jgi:hypothetical protein
VKEGSIGLIAYPAGTYVYSRNYEQTPNAAPYVE